MDLYGRSIDEKGLGTGHFKPIFGLTAIDSHKSGNIAQWASGSALNGYGIAGFGVFEEELLLQIAGSFIGNWAFGHVLQ
jgi:hypothetical protein